MLSRKRREQVTGLMAWLEEELRVAKLERSAAMSTGRHIDAAYHAGRLYELERFYLAAGAPLPPQIAADSLPQPPV
jgi:hypothetical protein